MQRQACTSVQPPWPPNRALSKQNSQAHKVCRASHVDQQSVRCKEPLRQPQLLGGQTLSGQGFTYRNDTRFRG